jgi:two-component system, sensor histidine kinase and response regulator
MEKRDRLIQKLSNLINDEKKLLAVSEIFNSELEAEIVKYNSSFNNYFFAKSEYHNNNLQVEYSNTIFNVIGYSAEQINSLPNKLNSIIHEDDRLRVENRLNAFFENSKVTDFSISYRVLSEDGEEVYLHESIAAFRNNEGKVVEYNSIFFNVSEMEKKKREADDLSDEMIKVNRRKDKFISIVSHDLKSPYTTLLGFSEILLNDNALPEEEKKEYLEYIHNSSQHQLNFIENLFDWSRLRTGRTAIEEQRLNVGNLMSTVISRFTGIAVRKNITISQNVQSDVFVKSDEKQLSKAISGLLQNALNFSHKDSVISIYVNRFKNGMVEIIIKDKGIGISEIDQEKLFKLDEKYSREGTEGEQGSGIGLILVKEIIEKLKGDIWFYSKENEGSEFHITIPEAKNIVLLIDDNVGKLKERGRKISDALPNYLLLKASNGYVALDYISDELPSVVVTKDELPLMSAHEIIKGIRNKDKYFSVAIFVLADDGLQEIDEKYNYLAIDGVYDYEIDNKKLIKIIKQNLK